jgi:hypothetical protein
MSVLVKSLVKSNKSKWIPKCDLSYPFHIKLCLKWLSVEIEKSLFLVICWNVIWMKILNWIFIKYLLYTQQSLVNRWSTVCRVKKWTGRVVIDLKHFEMCAISTPANDLENWTMWLFRFKLFELDILFY